ncbi:hypothetical protein [Streptomyces olivochromogenes]|nr:hypothetical protein [Streptomyces olivochromogenes]MCF3129833.1 hypothetical protein [Streptomyces olivochromogenes]
MKKLFKILGVVSAVLLGIAIVAHDLSTATTLTLNSFAEIRDAWRQFSTE